MDWRTRIDKEKASAERWPKDAIRNPKRTNRHKQSNQKVTNNHGRNERERSELEEPRKTQRRHERLANTRGREPHLKKRLDEKTSGSAPRKGQETQSGEKEGRRGTRRDELGCEGKAQGRNKQYGEDAQGRRRRTQRKGPQPRPKERNLKGPGAERHRDEERCTQNREPLNKGRKPQRPHRGIRKNGKGQARQKNHQQSIRAE